MSWSQPESASARLSGASTSKAVAALATYEGVQKFQVNARQYWHKHFAYTVTVSERDVLYADVHNWLLSITPNEKHRSLLVSSTSQNNRTPVSSDDEEPTVKPLTVRFNDSDSRTVYIDGHKVTVQLRTPEVPANASAYREPEASIIELTSKSYAAQQAIINHLHRLNAERATTRKAVLRMVGQWGGWKTRSDLPARTMDSVSLPADQKDRITADLRFFLEAEDKYNRLAIPWHRGYMFHGPPGTGKTSLVKALANEFNLDLWYVSLADLKAESSLLGLLAEVGPRSLLLLEDIDTMKITNDNEQADQGTISIGSLLNTLDGVGTPHGLITIMTTNNFDKLDDRLTRAGRMDLVEMLDYPSVDMISDLFKHFYGYTPSWYGHGDGAVEGVSAAQIAEIFKRNMSEPRNAEDEVYKLLISECVIEGKV